MGNRIRNKVIAIGLVATLTIGIALHHNVDANAQNTENSKLCQTIPGLKSAVTKRNTTTYKMYIDGKLVTYKVTKKGKVKKLTQTTSGSDEYFEMVQIEDELTLSTGKIKDGKYTKKSVTVVDLAEEDKEVSPTRLPICTTAPVMPIRPPESELPSESKQPIETEKPIASTGPVETQFPEESKEPTEEEQTAQVQNAFIRAFYAQYKENYWLQNKEHEAYIGCKLDNSKYGIKKDELLEEDMLMLNQYAASIDEFSNLKRENSKDIALIIRMLIAVGVADGKMLLALISCITPLTAIFALLFFTATTSVIVYTYLKYLHRVEDRLARMDVLSAQLGDQYKEVAKFGVAY